MLESEPSRDYNLPIDGDGASVKSPSLKKGQYTSAASKNVVPRLGQSQSRIALG